MANLRKQLVEFVQRPGYAAMKPKALAKKLGVTKKQVAEFEAALAQAEAKGEVKLNSSGRVQAKKPADAHVGVIRKISSGDAYLILKEPKPVNITGDIFIALADLRDAQSGDVVLVKLLSRRRSSGQRCGYVVEIMERSTNVFVGTYFEEQGGGWVRIDGKDYTDPIWVGDPGAKGAQEGDKVVIEMLRFPSMGQVGEAVLTKVLGARGEVGVDTQMVVHEFGIPNVFPEEALEEARAAADHFSESDLEGREDLTRQLIVTIDPVDARDFDDAISLERTANGHWLLGVHIADVSHFVTPGSALDDEAQLRGTSVYLPGLVIPMLPEVISNGLASLQQDRVRYTLSAFIEYTAEGVPVHTRLARTAIRVVRRFAYEEVMPLLPGTPAEGQAPVTNEVLDLLKRMHELAMLLRRRRFAKGSLNLDMPEVKLDINRDGLVTGAHEAEHDQSHQLIEEFMLAANIAVATELNDLGHNFLRRVHADPALLKLRALGEFVNLLGFPLQRVQSRFDLQRLLELVRGKPEERAVNFALLRSLKQAEYSPVEMGHYALAEEQYCHFTSPIRRYPDLLVHRLVFGILTENKAALSPSMEELLRLGSHCSMAERRAEKAERQLVKIKLLTYMESRVGEQLDAVITGVDRFGFFCQGVEIPAEGLVHLSTLSDRGYFEFDRAAMALVERGSGETFRLGDRVRVEVAQVDVDRRELNYRLVGRKVRRVALDGGERGFDARAPQKGKRSQPKATRGGRKPPKKSSRRKRR